MFNQTDVARAAAELIEKVYCHADSDNVRGSGEEYIRLMTRRIEAMLPPSPLPTLADMTLSERSSCQWMQADVKARGRGIILIVSESSDGCAAILDQSGVVTYENHSRITPRPDLPRFEWPDADQEVEDANTAKNGDLIKSADDPRFAALPVGSILLDLHGDTVTKERWGWAGLGHHPIPSEGDEFGPWKVIYIVQEADQ